MVGHFVFASFFLTSTNAFTLEIGEYGKKFADVTCVVYFAVYQLAARSRKTTQIHYTMEKEKEQPFVVLLHSKQSVSVKWEPNLSLMKNIIHLSFSSLAIP